MNAAKSALGALLLGILLLSSVTTAHAQAAPPIGRWAQSRPGTESLIVTPGGQCGFFVGGRVQVSGSCTWQSTSRGGILTITYPMPLEPGHVRYSIVWINRTTITVFGDVMHKLPG